MPPVRILFDNGAGNAPGAPGPGFEKAFDDVPAVEQHARRRGTWARTASSADKAGGGGADQFTWDADARPPTNFTGNTGSGDLWTAHPNYQWSQNPAGNALSYVTPPLAEDTDRPRRRRGAGLGPLRGEERRPAGDRHRGPSRRQGDVRPGRLAADRAPASWTSEELARPSRCRACASRTSRRCRRASSSRCGSRSTTRATCTARARGCGSSSRRRAAISRPGRSARPSTDPEGTPWVAVAHSKKMPSRLVLPGRQGRRRADRPAGVPRPARRAVPGLRAVRERDVRRRRRQPDGRRPRDPPDSGRSAASRFR